MGRSTKYPNETLDERKARQRFATKQRVQKSRLRQKEMKALAAIQLQRAQEANCHNTLALLDAASKASELAALTPKRNVGRLWAPHEAEALRKGVEKYGMGKWQMILRDDVFGPVLKDRSNVDLKDKWRCLMGRTHLTVAASSALVELARQPSTNDLTELGEDEDEDEDEVDDDDLYNYASTMSDAESEPDSDLTHGRNPLRAMHSHAESLAELATSGHRRPSATHTPTAPPSPSPATKRAPVSPKDSEDDTSTGLGDTSRAGSEEPLQTMQMAMELVAQARQRAEEELALAESFLHRARSSLTSIASKEADLQREWNRLNRRRPTATAAGQPAAKPPVGATVTTRAQRTVDTAHSKPPGAADAAAEEHHTARTSGSEGSTSAAAEAEMDAESLVAHAMLALDDAQPAEEAAALTPTPAVNGEDEACAMEQDAGTQQAEEKPQALSYDGKGEGSHQPRSNLPTLISGGSCVGDSKSEFSSV